MPVLKMRTCKHCGLCHPSLMCPNLPVAEREARRAARAEEREKLLAQRRSDSHEHHSGPAQVIEEIMENIHRPHFPIGDGEAGEENGVSELKVKLDVEQTYDDGTKQKIHYRFDEDLRFETVSDISR